MIDCGLKRSKELTVKSHKDIGKRKYSVDGKAESQNSINVILEKLMISMSLADVPHDLTVHSCMQHQSIDPTSLNDTFSRDEVLKSDD